MNDERVATDGHSASGRHDFRLVAGQPLGRDRRFLSWPQRLIYVGNPNLELQAEPG
jgi:hypothetical protein